MRRELQWETTLERLKQQLAQLKGEGSHKAAEDTAEGQARQLSTIRHLTGLTAAVPMSHLAEAVCMRISSTGQLFSCAASCPDWLANFPPKCHVDMITASKFAFQRRD